MQSIALSNEDNTGSLAKLHMIPVEDVVSIPDPEDYVVVDPVVLDIDCMWYTMQFTQDTPGFEESENKSKSGSFFNINLDGFIPGHNPVLTSILCEMRHRKWIIIATDHDGQKRLIGSLKNPVRFKWKFNTGNKTSGRKGYDFTFYNQAKNPPYFYESPYITYPDTISPDADFITLDALLASLTARVEALEEFSHERNKDQYLDYGGENETAVDQVFLTNGGRKMEGDLDVDDNAIIIKSPSGNRWKFTVGDDGMIVQPGEDLGT